jgi:sugar phosphate isomerase/epimerase
MLQIACHAWAYNNRPLEEAIGTIARLGFRHIDLGSGPHLDPERAATQPNAEAQRIRGLLEANNLILTDLYLMLPYINAPEPRRRAGQIALFERLLPFALALGTPGITISPGIYHADGQQHAFARSIPALLHMSQIAEDTDIRLSFEAHMDSSATTPEQAATLLECVPGLSLTLDYAHFFVQGYSLGELAPLLPYTAHVHVRQAVKGRLQTPFDQGRLDLSLLMRDLHTADYRGVTE